MTLPTEAPAGPYVDALLAAAPPGVSLPDPIVSTLRWMEEHGFIYEHQGHDGSVYRTMLLYPDLTETRPGHSMVEFRADPDFMRHWTDRPGADAHVFVFATTGGEGSRAGVWKDETGTLRFVHLGSGSGSAWVEVLTDDPVDFLRFLAVGYVEPAFQASDKSPLEAYLADEGFETLEDMRAEYADTADGADAWVSPPIPPTALQGYLQETFGRPIPRAAAELVPSAKANIDDETSSDPFQAWLNATP